MNIEDYKANISSLQIDYYIINIKNALETIMNAISSVLEERNLPNFVFFFDYPPDDTINEYYNPSQFDGKWIDSDRPIICIVRNTSNNAITDKESIVSYDINSTFTFDFIYPHYNISEENNSYDKFNRFLCIFSDMFEQTGRTWYLNNNRLFVDRTAISTVSNDYAIFAEVLCHVARCEVTFTIWKQSITEALYLWGSTLKDWKNLTV